jgi:hypothetical protein
LEGVKDFASDVALEASHYFVLGFTFGGAPCHVVAGGLVAAQSHDQDDVQSSVGVTVTAAVESVPDGFAAGGFQWADPAEFGEGGLGGDRTRSPTPAIR